MPSGRIRLSPRALTGLLHFPVGMMRAEVALGCGKRSLVRCIQTFTESQGASNEALERDLAGRDRIGVFCTKCVGAIRILRRYGGGWYRSRGPKREDHRIERSHGNLPDGGNR